MDNKSESRVRSIPVRDSGEKNSDSESFPDGGLRAWLVVLGAFFGLFVSFGWTNCATSTSYHGITTVLFMLTLTGVGVFQEYYETHQLASLSPGTVSWIPSLTIFTVFIAVIGSFS